MSKHASTLSVHRKYDSAMVQKECSSSMISQPTGGKRNFQVNRSMRKRRIRDAVALLTFQITTFPELFIHYHDMRQIQTFRTLIPGIHHQ